MDEKPIRVKEIIVRNNHTRSSNKIILGPHDIKLSKFDCTFDFSD